MVSIVLRLGLGLELGLAINVRCGCLSQDRVNFKKKNDDFDVARRSATPMQSRGMVAKVCATKIATNRWKNIKTKWPPKTIFFFPDPQGRCGHFLNVIFSAKTKTATCRD